MCIVLCTVSVYCLCVKSMCVISVYCLHTLYSITHTTYSIINYTSLILHRYLLLHAYCFILNALYSIYLSPFITKNYVHYKNILYSMPYTPWYIFLLQTLYSICCILRYIYLIFYVSYSNTYYQFNTQYSDCIQYIT